MTKELDNYKQKIGGDMANWFPRFRLVSFFIVCINLNSFRSDAFVLTQNSNIRRWSSVSSSLSSSIYPLYSVVNTDDGDIDMINNNIDDEQQQQKDQENNNNVQWTRYRCRVTYNGATYNGFQLQPNARTVQGELESAFSRRCNQNVVRVVGAGRTDAGVHARGQAIHFDIKHTIIEKDKNNDSVDELNVEEDDDLVVGYNETELQQIERSINRMLHPTLRIWNLQRAPKPCVEYVNGSKGLYRWNVMRKSHGKLYSYRFSTSSCMDPIERHTRWQLDLSAKKRQEVNEGKRRSVLDIEYLRKLLKYYEGTHDFGCFAGAVEQQQKKNAARKKQKQKQMQKQQLQMNLTVNDKEQSAATTELQLQDNEDEGDDDISPLDTIRTVYSVTLVEEEGENENYRIDIALEGALYKMVRNMVGTALDVCLGRNNLTEEQFKAMLSIDNDDSNNNTGGDNNTTDDDSEQKKKIKKKAARQNNPSKPAPPQGLTLEWVYYDDEDAQIF